MILFAIESVVMIGFALLLAFVMFKLHLPITEGLEDPFTREFWKPLD